MGYALPLVALAVWASILWIDLPVAEWSFTLSKQAATDWMWYAGNDVSALGDSTVWLVGFTLVLLMRMFLVRQHRNWIKPHHQSFAIHGLASVLLSGIVVRIIKLVTSRARPSDYFNDHVYGFFWSFDHHLNSFPSGHVATIVCVAMCFSLVAPRARYFLFIIVLAVMCGRLISAKHYVSDVLAGAYIGVVTTYFVRMMINRCRKPTIQAK